MLSTLLRHPPTQQLGVIEQSLEVLKEIIALPMDFEPYIRQIISGLVSLYHSPHKVKLENSLSNANRSLNKLIICSIRCLIYAILRII